MPAVVMVDMERMGFGRRSASAPIGGSGSSPAREICLELADRADATGSSAGPERPPPQLQGPVRLPHERHADGQVRTRHHAVRPREDGVLRARGLRARHVSARRWVAAAVELAGRVHDGGDALRLPATHDPGGVRSAGRRRVWSPGRRRAGERVPERSASTSRPRASSWRSTRRGPTVWARSSSRTCSAAMPIIRYRIGDMGELDSSACPCGRTPVPQAPRRAAHRFPRDPGGVGDASAGRRVHPPGGPPDPGVPDRPGGGRSAEHPGRSRCRLHRGDPAGDPEVGRAGHGPGGAGRGRVDREDRARAFGEVPVRHLESRR